MIEDLLDFYLFNLFWKIIISCLTKYYTNKQKGTAMGTKFAPSYVRLTVGLLEETKLFPEILLNYFSVDIC